MNNEENNNNTTEAAPSTIVIENSTTQTAVPVVEPQVQIPTTPVVEPKVQETVASVVEEKVTSTLEPTPQTSNIELPPSPTEQVVVPAAANTEPVVIETVKKKGSNTILVILILLFALSIFYIDDIIKFFEDNVISTNPSSVKETDNYNLVDGFILLDDNTSYMKLENVKFYNFKKNSTDMSLSLNYVSDKSYSKSSDIGLYIELYNSDKELLYKEIFNTTESIDKNMVRTYSIKLTSDVYADAFYSLVKLYTKEDLAKTSILTCKYKLVEEGYDILYKNTYNFTNNALSSYEVLKELNITTNNASSKKYANEIKNEYEKINKVGITNTYENNKLNYKVDLNNLPEEFMPLYDNTLTPTIIKNKDTLKKWECE